MALRYEFDEEISLKIADTVWNKIKSRDVRDLLRVGRSQDIDDVGFVASNAEENTRGRMGKNESIIANGKWFFL